MSCSVSGMRNSSATLDKRNALRKHWRETVAWESFPREVERKCSECDQLKMCSWSSSFTQTGKPEYRIRCKDCHNKYLSRINKAKRPRRTSQALDRKSRVKRKCVEYLGGRCYRCGYDKCIKALTFHHRDANAKIFTVSQMLDRSWGILVSELDKCDLLCFNCHMEEHCGIDGDTRAALNEPRRFGCKSH